MEKATQNFMFRRVYPLYQVGQAIETDMKSDRTFVRAIQKEDESHRASSKTSTYSTTVRWKSVRGEEVETRVFVKMASLDPESGFIPKTFLNELYLMKTVVRGMARYGRSPHFIIPITQVYDGGVVPDDVFSLERLIGTELGEERKVSIFNVMEYLDPRYHFNLKDLLRSDDLPVSDLVFGLKQVFFQVFYNLAVMERYKFRHGDLHLENVMISRVDPSTVPPIIYSPDPQTYFKVDNHYFSYVIDFDRSTLHNARGNTLALSEEELPRFPCVSEDRMDLLPYGLREGCHDWNPYADWTRIVAAFMLSVEKHRGKELLDVLTNQLFSSANLYSVVTEVLGDVHKYRFGRPSLRELMDHVPERTLRRATPGVIFREYARQFVSESWLQLLKVPEPGVPIFKAY